MLSLVSKPILLSVIILGVVMLNVVAPVNKHSQSLTLNRCLIKHERSGIILSERPRNTN
jgi:hypothetical protein